MRYLIIVPVLNAARLIPGALMGLASQLYEGVCDVVFVDGHSVDQTQSVLADMQAVLTRCCVSDMRIEWMSQAEPDAGLYAAVADGFRVMMQRHQYDWITWLGVDDVLMPGSIGSLCWVNSFSNPSVIEWLIGNRCVRDYGSGAVVSYEPIWTPRRIFAAGAADGVHWDVPQQEGVWFRPGLYERLVDVDRFKSFKLSGDWFLWLQFAKGCVEPIYYPFPTGCFSRRLGQLSSEKGAYLREIDAHVSRAKRREAFEGIGPRSLCSRIMVYDCFQERTTLQLSQCSNLYQARLDSVSRYGFYGHGESRIRALSLS